MKLERMSLTVPKELLEKSDKIAKEKLEDRSTVIRELLSLGIKQYMMDEALKIYIDDKASLEKAAELADVSIWRFLDLLKDKRVPLRYDKESIQKEIGQIIH